MRSFKQYYQQYGVFAFDPIRDEKETKTYKDKKIITDQLEANELEELLLNQLCFSKNWESNSFLTDVLYKIKNNHSLKKIKLIRFDLSSLEKVFSETISTNNSLEEIVFYNCDNSQRVSLELSNLPRFKSRALRIDIHITPLWGEEGAAIREAGIGFLDFPHIRKINALDSVMQRTLDKLTSQVQTTAVTALTNAIRFGFTPQLFVHKAALSTDQLGVIFAEFKAEARFEIRLQICLAEFSTELTDSDRPSVELLAIQALERLTREGFADLEKYQVAFTTNEELRSLYELYQRENPAKIELDPSVETSTTSPAAGGAGSIAPVPPTIIKAATAPAMGGAGAAGKSSKLKIPKSFVIKTTGLISKTSSEIGILPPQLVAEEYLAYQLYALCGVKVPKTYLVHTAKEGLGIASKILVGYQNFGNLLLHRKADGGKYTHFNLLKDNKLFGKPILGLAQTLTVAAWLYDYDAVGRDFDNIGIINEDDHYQAVKIDPGSACLAELPTGEKLSERSDYMSGFETDLEYGLILKEFRTVAHWNFYYLFEYVTASEKLAALANIAKLSDEAIYDVIFNPEIPTFALSDERRNIIFNELIARRNLIRSFVGLPIGFKASFIAVSRTKKTSRPITDFFTRGEQILSSGNAQPLIFHKQKQKDLLTTKLASELATELSLIPEGTDADELSLVLDELLDQLRERLKKLTELEPRCFKSEKDREALIEECIDRITKATQRKVSLRRAGDTYSFSSEA